MFYSVCFLDYVNSTLNFLIAGDFLDCGANVTRFTSSFYLFFHLRLKSAIWGVPGIIVEWCCCRRSQPVSVFIFLNGCMTFAFSLLLLCGNCDYFYLCNISCATGWHSLNTAYSQPHAYSNTWHGILYYTHTVVVVFFFFSTKFFWKLLKHPEWKYSMSLLSTLEKLGHSIEVFCALRPV